MMLFGTRYGRFVTTHHLASWSIVSTTTATATSRMISRTLTFLEGLASKALERRRVLAISVAGRDGRELS